MLWIRLLAATVLLMAVSTGSPFVVGRLTINNGLGGNYATGEPWTITLADAPRSVPFTICAQVGESEAFCTASFARTDENGAWRASGRFELAHAGEWTEWLQFPSVAVSSRVSFKVGGSSSGAFTINNAPGGTFQTGQTWVLSLTGGPPNAQFDLCGAANLAAPTCVSAFGTTNSSGSWTTTGTFPASAAGGWTEWLRFTSGTVSNRISFTVGTSINYLAYGMNFGPYVAGQDPNTGAIITEAQVSERLSKVAPFVQWVRSFGSTRGLEHFGRLARGFGLKTAVGVWLGRNASANDQEIAGALAAYRNGYADILIIGSETLYRRDLTAAELVGYINRVRQEAPGAVITTGDTYASLMDNPSVVTACDVIFVNLFPYWQGIDVNQAITQLNVDYQALKSRYPQKEIIISESGWPSSGNTIGSAVPSPQNAALYFLNFVSWARALNIKYFYFEAFNEPFKSAYEGPQGAFWGVMETDGTLKPGMLDVFSGRTLPNNWSDTGQLLPGGPGTPAIQFTTVPPRGSSADLKGQVLHVNPADYYVAVYIRVRGAWWTKPYWAEPRTRINVDGTWICDITTGGVDTEADQIAAYVLPNSFSVPLASGGSLPSLGATAIASATVNR